MPLPAATPGELEYAGGILMVRKLSILFMSLFFLALMGSIVWINASRPRILVLHSYDSDYIGTRGVNSGLKQVLEGRPLLDLRFHEMGTKKRSDPEYIRRATLAAHQAIQNANPDVLIAVDDLAQAEVARHYLDHPKIAIVFAGVNGGIDPYGYDKAGNVTGILEHKTGAPLQEAVLVLADAQGLPREYKPRVLFLADTSHSTALDDENLRAFPWDRVNYLGRRSIETYEAWKEAVSGIGKEADFLLVGGYRQLRRSSQSEEFVPAGEVMRWTEANSPIPAIGMNVFNSEDGAMLSIGVSPYEQGEVAAKLAMQILKEHKRPSDIPIRTASQFVVAMRREALEARGIHVPKVFEAFARATNNYLE